MRHAARLDYEAELCLIPLADIVRPDQEVEFGLLLCNDFTDRWTLVREIDLGEPWVSPASQRPRASRPFCRPVTCS